MVTKKLIFSIKVHIENEHSICSCITLTICEFADASKVPSSDWLKPFSCG